MTKQEKYILDRIKIDDNGCHIWTGSKAGAGYGALRVRGKRVYAHRFVYEYYRGKIPDGLTLDHLCHNRICVNPEHLEAVTLKVNLLRGDGFYAINARKTHCLRGHELSPDNLVKPDLPKRRCRKCTNRKHRDLKRRQRAL